MYSSSPIGLSLCSWNANGLLRKIAELRIFIEKHSPDIFLIQETHLRPSHNFNIANYTCHRNDRISDGPRTAGGTLILVKNSLKHYYLPTPPLRALEATNIILTPPKHDPISITSVYIPPSSDENLFTIDIEHFIQTASNCILFGDFNATHNAWNYEEPYPRLPDSIARPIANMPLSRMENTTFAMPNIIDSRLRTVLQSRRPKINAYSTPYTRAFGDGPRNFEPGSSDVENTCAGTPSPNYHTTAGYILRTKRRGSGISRALLFISSGTSRDLGRGWM
ncbi:putative RNA-directed DNA polymerase from transposon X-element [Trichonephila clavipes]|nr:putative RNA-directed DNA polymerase from transposon X-element [Trichonephila clavipes]